MWGVKEAGKERGNACAKQTAALVAATTANASSRADHVAFNSMYALPMTDTTKMVFLPNEYA